MIEAVNEARKQFGNLADKYLDASDSLSTLSLEAIGETTNELKGLSQAISQKILDLLAQEAKRLAAMMGTDDSRSGIEWVNHVKKILNFVNQEYGDLAPAVLGEVLKEPSRETRRDAIHILGELGEAGFDGLLWAVLHEEDELNANNAAIAAEKLVGREPSAEEIALMIERTGLGGMFQGSAILMLSCTLPKSTPVLRTAFEASDTEGKTVLARVFAQAESRANGAVVPLMRALRSSSAALRELAAKALGSIKPKGAFVAQRLATLLRNDEDAGVRTYAACALRQIGLFCPEIVSAFATGLLDGDDRIAYQCLLGLQECGKAAAPALPSLRKLRDRRATWVSQYALNAELRAFVKELEKEAKSGS